MTNIARHCTSIAPLPDRESQGHVQNIEPYCLAWMPSQLVHVRPQQQEETSPGDRSYRLSKAPANTCHYKHLDLSVGCTSKQVKPRQPLPCLPGQAATLPSLTCAEAAWPQRPARSRMGCQMEVWLVFKSTHGACDHTTAMLPLACQRTP